MEVSEVRRPKALEDENAKLKKLLAMAIPDLAGLKNVAAR
jgi:putative transposase